MTLESLLELAKQAEFSHYGPLNVAALEFRPEVREMCAADKCRSYGRSWTCPPHCGTLEEMAARAQGYPMGILVQSTAELEDDFDIETMMDTERVHKERFVRLCEAVRGPVPSAPSVPALTHPAASRTGPFPPWRPVGWWSARCARVPACPITTALRL